MQVDKDTKRAIGRYLEKVSAELASTPPDEKDSILEGVESHIYETLSRRAPENPTLRDLEAVLAEMAPPSSYGKGAAETARRRAPSQPLQSASRRFRPDPGLSWLFFMLLLSSPAATEHFTSGVITVLKVAVIVAGVVLGAWIIARVWRPASPAPAAPSASPEPAERRFSKHAVIAAAIAPLGLVALAFFVLSVFEILEHDSGYVLWFAAAVCPAVAFPTTSLGLVAVSRIRASKGAVVGMPLSVTTAILFPLVFLDIILFFVGGELGDVLGHGKGVTVGCCMATLLFVALDVLLVIVVWRWANRTLAPGEFT